MTTHLQALQLLKHSQGRFINHIDCSLCRILVMGVMETKGTFFLEQDFHRKLEILRLEQNSKSDISLFWNQRANHYTT